MARYADADPTNPIRGIIVNFILTSQPANAEQSQGNRERGIWRYSHQETVHEVRMDVISLDINSALRQFDTSWSLFIDMFFDSASNRIKDQQLPALNLRRNICSTFDYFKYQMSRSAFGCLPTSMTRCTIGSALSLPCPKSPLSPSPMPTCSLISFNVLVVSNTITECKRTNSSPWCL